MNLNQEASSLKGGIIRKALHEVFIKIVPTGILPGLRADNFRFKKTGIFESKGGSVCMECSNRQISEMSQRYSEDFNIASVIEVLSACTALNCFVLFCTDVGEALLFREVYWPIWRKYVC